MAGFYKDGYFISVIDEDNTASFRLEKVETWHYALELFEGSTEQPTITEQTLLRSPETDLLWHPDREQRRYEIARSVLAAHISKEGSYSVDAKTGIGEECERAIAYADNLLELLKTGNDGKD